MEIRTERLLLRELHIEDFAALSEIQSHPEVHTYEQNTISSLDEVLNYIEKAGRWALDIPRTHFRLAITVPPSGQVCGRLTLTLNWAEIREWEIGWQLHPEEWGKGYATEAAQAVLAYAFHELKAHRVVAFCNFNNDRSTRVMERLGMTREATLRETRWWRDAWTNEYLYAILEREFLKTAN